MDYYEAFIILGEIGVLPMEFTRKMTPLAGFRNILVHEYLGVDWDHVLKHLHHLQDLYEFSEYIRDWIQ